MRFLTIILLIGLCSCLTVGRIERNCDKFASICLEPQVADTVFTNTVDTVLETRIEYIDRVVKLPSDTVRERVPVYIRDGVIIADTVIAETEVAKAMAYVLNNELKLHLSNKDSFQILNDKIEVYERTITELKEQVITEPTIIKEKRSIFEAAIILAFFVGMVVATIILYYFLKND